MPPPSPPPPPQMKHFPQVLGGYGTYLHKTFVSRWTPTVRRLLDQQGRDHLGEGVGEGTERREGNTVTCSSDRPAPFFSQTVKVFKLT